jgi:hypothetical protein
MTIDKILEWMIGFIAPHIFTKFGSARNIALSLVYTLYISPFHRH